MKCIECGGRCVKFDESETKIVWGCVSGCDFFERPKRKRKTKGAAA